MSHPQEIRDIFVYAVRRRASRPGPAEEVLWHIKADERAPLVVGPIGTFAAQALRYLRHWEKEPAWQEVVRLAHCCRRLVVGESSFETKDLAAVNVCAEEATWEWPELPWRAGASSGWLWRLPNDPMRRGTVAMCLSARLGARKLRVCVKCREPFALSPKEAGWRVCPECRDAKGVRTHVTGLSVRDRRLMDRLDQRLRQWVARGTIADEHRNVIRAQLVEDLLQRRITASSLPEKFKSLPLHFGPGAREKNRTAILKHFGLHERTVAFDGVHAFRVGTIPFDLIFGVFAGAGIPESLEANRGPRERRKKA